MTIEQQGDVTLCQTDDNGEILAENGLIVMAGGLETAAYLSLFGGNEEDDGRDGNPMQWWGNLGETEDERKYRSETQYLLQSIPAIPINLRRIEDAVKRDLQWLLTTRTATSIDVETTMPGLNQVKISVAINAVGDPVNIEYIENWKVDA